MAHSGRRGGAGTAGGMNFQHAATAWLAVGILAESASAPPWDLPAITTLESLRAETELEANAVPVDQWPVAVLERARALGELVEQTGREVYFAAGSFERGDSTEGSELTDDQRQRFYRETSEVLDEPTDTGFASVAHHMLETLEGFVPMDPEASFCGLPASSGVQRPRDISTNHSGRTWWCA